MVFFMENMRKKSSFFVPVGLFKDVISCPVLHDIAYVLNNNNEINSF